MKTTTAKTKKIRVTPNVLDVYLGAFRGQASSCNQHLHPDEYEWFYCREGGGVQEVRQWQKRISPGDFLMIPPGVPHVFCAQTGGCKAEVLMLPRRYFAADSEANGEARALLDHLTGHVEKNGYLFRLEREEGERCGNLLHAILGLQRNPAFGNALRLRTLIGDLLEVAFRLPSPPRNSVPQGAGEPNRRISELLFYLDSQYVRPVAIGEALKITGMSRSSFHIHFQEATGKTFCQYLNDLRLAAAEQLIRDGASPEEAAKRSGFTSRSNYYQQRRNHEVRDR